LGLVIGGERLVFGPELLPFGFDFGWNVLHIIVPSSRMPEFVMR
jgi:hypothetical protein